MGRVRTRRDVVQSLESIDARWHAVCASFGSETAPSNQVLQDLTVYICAGVGVGVSGSCVTSRQRGGAASTFAVDWTPTFIPA